MQTATRNGARARAINGTGIGPTGLSICLWVHLSSKGVATSTSGRTYRNYTIFEGTSEIQRLNIFSRHLRRSHQVTARTAAVLGDFVQKVL